MVLVYVFPLSAPPSQEAIRHGLLSRSQLLSVLRDHRGNSRVTSLRSKRSCAFLAKGKPRIGERTSFGLSPSPSLHFLRSPHFSCGQNSFASRSWVFLSLKTHRNACYAGYRVTSQTSDFRKGQIFLQCFLILFTLVVVI